MNNESLFENSQLVVSHELLQFLRWIVTTEPEALKILMRQALESDAIISRDHLNWREDTSLSHEELQRSVVDFFDFVETTLHDVMHAEDTEEKVNHQSLRPTVNTIDSSLCDEETVALSVAQANSQLQSATPQLAKEALYRELLKNWRPRNKNLLH